MMSENSAARTLLFVVVFTISIVGVVFDSLSSSSFCLSFTSIWIHLIGCFHVLLTTPFLELILPFFKSDFQIFLMLFTLFHLNVSKLGQLSVQLIHLCQSVFFSIFKLFLIILSYIFFVLDLLKLSFVILKFLLKLSHLLVQLIRFIFDGSKLFLHFLLHFSYFLLVLAAVFLFIFKRLFQRSWKLGGQEVQKNDTRPYSRRRICFILCAHSILVDQVEHILL